MDLVCVERLVTDNQKAAYDPVIFKNIRVLQNLLQIEDRYLPKCDYFTEVQEYIKPHMRKLVASWMLEVCEEYSCEDQVFPLAINFLDRFLCVCPILKNQLQLSAAASLLLAIKIRQCRSVSLNRICFFADNSITPNQMRAWELLVLSKLNWDIFGVTGFDFVDHVIERLPLEGRKHWSLLRSHARVLLALGLSEPEYIGTKSSIMGAAAVVAAARGLLLFKFENDIYQLLRTDFTTVDPIVMELELIMRNMAKASVLDRDHERALKLEMDMDNMPPTALNLVHF